VPICTAPPRGHYALIHQDSRADLAGPFRYHQRSLPCRVGRFNQTGPSSPRQRGWTAAQRFEHIECRPCLRPFEQAAGAVEEAGAGASLGGGDEVEDGCSEPLEFDDGAAGTCAPAVVRGFATR
jgi:hypothetical protein